MAAGSNDGSREQQWQLQKGPKGTCICDGWASVILMREEMHQHEDKDIYSPTSLLFNRSVYKLKAFAGAPC